VENQLNIAEIQNVLAKADELYTHSQVSTAFDNMAVEIHQRLHDKNPVCLELDYIHATRYRGATSGSDLQWIKYPSISLEGRTVLVIDDILDEGLTLQAIVKYCQEAGAQEVLTAVLVEKQLNNRPGLHKADFTGLTVPNRYVFGFGMDYQGQLRYAPGIYAVHGL